MQTLEAVLVVEAVEAVEKARKRIPDELSDYTFFTVNDLWHYFAVGDHKLCEYCEVNNGMDFIGDVLRGKFPDLEIVDANTIYPHVHVTLGWSSPEDDHCRCVLMRVAAPIEILTERMKELGLIVTEE